MIFITKHKKSLPKAKNAILIEGLPGIGNVGKLALDFVVESLKASKIMDLMSDAFPNSAFVNENDILELPIVSIFSKKVGKKNFYFLVGDSQPIDERASYEFSRSIVDIAKKLGVSTILTLGGIGLPAVPEHPKLYIAGSSQKIVRKYKTSSIQESLYGIVGPIMGVTGLLVGLAHEKKIEGATLISETFAHPVHLGFNGAREILKYLNSTFSFKLDMKSFDKYVNNIKSEIKGSTEKDKMKTTLKKLRKGRDTAYIG